MLKLDWKHWIYALVKTIIGGVASSGGAWMATLVGNQADSSIAVLKINQLWAVLLSSTLLNLFFFLKSSPLPDDTDAAVKPPTPPNP